MQIEQGSIIEGRITGITKYGAFVSIDSETSGMVHISEISSDFVKDVNDYFKLNQTIKAVVISINDNGKLALSVKQMPKDPDSSNNSEDNKNPNGGENSENPEVFVKDQKRSKAVLSDMSSFENMMNKFKHDSDEKISDLRKSLDPKKTRRRLNQNGMK
ncbi:MAG: S1 RNA-binding domain-containing protein [Oscillospiraceae bacterium]|nr:S1 RNA-binding domain-containing protein [Oscillospiraceae bacterium]